MATVLLLSGPIKLPDSFIVLVFDNFLSSVIRIAWGSCTVRKGLGKWQALTWKGAAGWNNCLPWSVNLWAHCWAVQANTFPSLTLEFHAKIMWIGMDVWVYHVILSQHTTNCILYTSFFACRISSLWIWEKSPCRLHMTLWFIGSFSVVPRLKEINICTAMFNYYQCLEHMSFQMEYNMGMQGI